MLPNILCLLLFLYIPCNAHKIVTKSCDDCVVFTECKSCIEMVRKGKSDETEALLRSSFCGFEDNQRREPKVCCSDWPQKILSRIQVIIDPIEDHPNLSLLPESCGDINGDRIIAGQTAGLYEFPWMALISYYTRLHNLDFRCAGTIINSRYILTAAHCVKNKRIAGVRVGEYQISTSPDCVQQSSGYICESHLQDSTVEDVIVHENYTLDLENDIALLRLNSTIDFSFKNVEPVCLPVHEKLRNETIAGSQVTVAGWGMTETDSHSDILLKTTITVTPVDICRNYLKRKYANNLDVVKKFMCASSPGRDACQGDSGGPMMLENEYRDAYRTIQVGIISQGPRNCGTGNTPGIYTDVTKYMGWILDHIKP